MSKVPDGQAAGALRATSVGAPAAVGHIAVSLRGVTKVFGAAIALDAATLDIYKGEFFSLLGPSGCGKSTLLRIIGGFEMPTSGDILIDGRSVLADPPYRRRTNMIFQNLALFPHLTVAENIAFGLEMQRLPRNAIRRKVEEALVLVRLSDYGARNINALSGGQRQRIAMARALVNEPEVLLLDEPLGALDLQLRLQMQEELRRLQRETRSTFVFVTHDQGEAISMSDRIGVMSGGRLLQVGTPQEVYEQPRQRFVAEFMGHSNFLTGRVGAISADRVGHVVVGDVRLPCRIPESIEPGTEALFVLRYEKIVVSAGGRLLPDGCLRLRGELVSENYMGATIRFEVKVADGLVLVADTGNAGGHEVGTVGDSVWLYWSIDGPTVMTE